MSGGGGLHVEIDVRVRVQRDGDARVPEPFLHDPGMDAGLQRQGRVGVPQVVQADSGDFASRAAFPNW